MNKYAQCQIIDGEIQFSSPEYKAAWLHEHEGKRCKITLHEDISYNLRKFFEGGVVPFFAYQHQVKGRNMSIEEARNCLKLEFNPVYTTDINGDRKVEGGDTSKLNKAKFQKFIDDIIDWMEMQGYIVPNSEDYKAWRDSAPAVGEIYPPLQRLINLRDGNN